MLHVAVVTSQSHNAAAAAAAGTAVGGEGGRDLDAAAMDHDGRSTTCRPQVDYSPELVEQITCRRHVVAGPSWSVAAASRSRPPSRHHPRPTAVAEKLPHCVTLRCHHSSLTSNWVETLTVPESPSPGLYATAAVQVWQLLSVECHSLAKFHCSEVVPFWTVC